MTNKNYQYNDYEFYTKVLNSLDAVANSNSQRVSKKYFMGLINDIVSNYEESKLDRINSILDNFEKRTSEEDRTYN